MYGTARFKLHEHTRVQECTHYTSMKTFATCSCALDSLMTYELLASNINARCVHILLAIRVHLTRATHEQFVYIKLFQTYLPSNVTSKSHFLKIVLIRLRAILFLLVNACHVCTQF